MSDFQWLALSGADYMIIHSHLHLRTVSFEYLSPVTTENRMGIKRMVYPPFSGQVIGRANGGRVLFVRTVYNPMSYRYNETLCFKYTKPKG